jgi:hypothetical protein
VHGKKEDILLSSKENNLLLTPLFWKRLRVDQYPKTLEYIFKHRMVRGSLALEVGVK